MDNTVLVALIGVLGTIVGTIAAGVFGYRTAAIELEKRKPEAVQHRCRISELDVYTYITGKKTQTPPACLYLDSSDSVTCRFIPTDTQADAMKMKHANENRCYLALFAKKYDLV